MCSKAGSAGSVTLACKGACFTPTIRQVLAPGLVGGPGVHHQLLSLHGRHGLQLDGGQSTLSAGVTGFSLYTVWRGTKGGCSLKNKWQRNFSAAAKFVYN